ncbi:MAG: VOC family protein [Candidatus Rokuibacteriota bacterium]
MSADSPATIRFEAAVPQFTVPDVAQTAEYYRDVLGFQISGYWDGERVSLAADPPPVFGIVWRDQIQVFFNRGDQSEVRMGRAEGAYDAYLRVTGLDALAAELRTRGADILDGPEDRIYGQRELVVRDCNGLILAFGENIDQRATQPAAAADERRGGVEVTLRTVDAARG